MKTRTLGRTGLEISEIIFGCGNVGGLMIDADPDTRTEAVRMALDGGINWFDTAAQYGQGKSEENLGRALAEIGAAPNISTKIRIEAEDMSDIPGAIERKTHEGLARLGRPSVTLLQVHNFIAPETGGRMIALERVLGPGGVADGLARMRDQGLTNFIGFTGLGDSTCCKTVAESGRFDAAQIYYNLINPTAARPLADGAGGQDFLGIIDRCKENGVGVIVIRPFAAAVIATDLRHGRQSILTDGTDLDDEFEKAHAALGVVGADQGTRAQIAVRFVLANADIACVNVGLGEISHLAEALEAAEMGPLGAAALAALDALYDDKFER